MDLPSRSREETKQRFSFAICMIALWVFVLQVQIPILWWIISRRIKSMVSWLWLKIVSDQMLWLDTTGSRRIWKMAFLSRVRKTIPELRRIIIFVKTERQALELQMVRKSRFWTIKFSAIMVKVFSLWTRHQATSKRTKSTKTTRLILPMEVTIQPIPSS